MYRKEIRVLLAMLLLNVAVMLLMQMLMAYLIFFIFNSNEL